MEEKRDEEGRRKGEAGGGQLNTLAGGSLGGDGVTASWMCT